MAGSPKSFTWIKGLMFRDFLKTETFKFQQKQHQAGEVLPQKPSTFSGRSSSLSKFQGPGAEDRLRNRQSFHQRRSQQAGGKLQNPPTVLLIFGWSSWLKGGNFSFHFLYMHQFTNMVGCDILTIFVALNWGLLPLFLILNKYAVCWYLVDYTFSTCNA